MKIAAPPYFEKDDYYFLFFYGMLADPVQLALNFNAVLISECLLPSHRLEFCGNGHLTIISDHRHSVKGYIASIQPESIKVMEKIEDYPNYYNYQIKKVYIDDDYRIRHSNNSKIYMPVSLDVHTFVMNPEHLTIAEPNPEYFETLLESMKDDHKKFDDLRQALYRSKKYLGECALD